MLAFIGRTVQVYSLRVLPSVTKYNSSFVLCTTSLLTRRFLSSIAMVNPKVKTVEDGIVKSAEDKRSYRGLELTNGLKILLVSDPTTDKASAAMDVHIGHMSDPDELPGLAHFCEHMLFLGTEKYPEENEYSKFLSEHGGSSNAYTSAEHTNYYFDVGPEHLNGALDRFAQFFLCPLFTISATEREVNAVNSENQKNLMVDRRRYYMFQKATGNPSHPYSKFGTGNKETLLTRPQEKGIDTREELLKFHAKHYSANLMTLAVLGKESLDELTDYIVPLFGDVENKNCEVPSFPEHPYGPKEVKLQAKIVPVKDVRSLNITWPIPDLHPHYKSNPGHYLGHLIGHEGPGSLLSELKKRGWVNHLMGGQKAGAKGFMFFIVNVDLSEDGIEHVDDIVTLTFQYLNLLRKEGPLEWVFRECQDLNAMQFRFKDKERPAGYTCNCAGALQEYPMKESLSGGYLLEEYRPDLVDMVMEKLTPETIRVAVIGKKFEGQTDQKEKWYGTEYKIEPIPQATLDKWSNAGLHENFQIPEKNEFIPTNFDIVTRDPEPAVVPEVLIDSNMVRLWYNQDNKFLLPKACVNVEITSPYAFMDPISTNLTYMFVTLFQDALTEYSYAAELAGLMYSLHNTIYGLTLSVKGYNDKQHILLQKIIEKMTSLEIDPQRFELLKDNYVRGLKNFKAEQPHQHAVYYTNVLMSEQLWTKDELLEATEELTVEKLTQFVPQLLSRMYIETLIYGNVTKDHAKKLAQIVTETLSKQANTKALLPSQHRRYREVQLPDGCYYLYKKENDVHRSSSLEVYYQCNMQETQTNMLLELFCQIISEPCFDTLRTQEQLGYIVFSGCRRSNGVQGLRVIVQSNRDPQYVENRVEAFLHSMEKHITEMSDEVFSNHVKALATKRMEKPKKMSTQNARFWSEIISQQYNFDRDNIEVAHLGTITKEDVIKFFNEYLGNEAPKRHKLCVHISSTAPGDGDSDNDTENPTKTLTEPPPSKESVEVKDVNAFKKQLGLFPLPKPYIKIDSAMSKL